jgi:putative nucleotidyltransferase with HDIG domain
MSKEHIIEQIINRIVNCGFEVHLCGGAVRDKILGHEPEDYDITTNSTPKELELMFHDRTVKKYGVSFLVTNIDGIDVATYRTEYNVGPGRFNAKTKPCKTLEEDLSRRDFTFNALAVNPKTGEVIDLFNGIQDLKNKVVRFIGEPEDRIFDDELRMIRAARFASLIEGTLEEQTFKAICKNKKLVLQIAPERIRMELLKVMKYPKPHIFFDVLWQTGILKLILPEFDALYGHTGGPHHGETLDQHAFMTGDSLSPKDPVFRLIGYLHDIGKPVAFNPETESFYGHAEDGAEMIEAVFERLKFPKSDTKRAWGIVRSHMRTIGKRSTDKAVRRTLKVFSDRGVTFKDWLRLKIADKNANLIRDNYTKDQIRTIVMKVRNAQIEKKKIGFDVTDLDINGHNVMEVLEVGPGKIIGDILNSLTNIVIDNPEKNEKELLIKVVKERFK